MVAFPSVTWQNGGGLEVPVGWVDELDCGMVGNVPRVRLGVVLLVPEPAASEVDGLRRALSDESLQRIPPHLTLVPPVNVPERQMGAAIDVLRLASAETPPIRVELGPPQTFWPNSPVIYLAVTGDTQEIHRLRERVMRPPLEREVTWPFVPHVTLMDGAEPDSMPEALSSMNGYRPPV